MKHTEKYELVKIAAGLALNAGRTAVQAFNASMKAKNVLPAASKFVGRGGTIGSANAVSKANRWRALKANPNFRNQIGHGSTPRYNRETSQHLSQFASRNAPQISTADRASRWNALGQVARQQNKPWLASTPAGFNPTMATASKSRIPDLLTGGRAAMQRLPLDYRHYSLMAGGGLGAATAGGAIYANS